MVDAKDAARYLLALFKADADKRPLPDAGKQSDISNLKLQKLLYYCQGYSLALTGKPMFGERIEAWLYGPVVRCVYDEYKHYSRDDIPLNEIEDFTLEDEQAAAIVRMVKRQLGCLSAIAIMDKTHGEPPWQEAFHHAYNSPISSDSMKKYFEGELCGEMSDEEEERLWNSASEPLNEEDARYLLTNVL